jgi:phosphotransacetylase
MLMKGRIDTPGLMRAVLDPEHGLRTGRAICQVVLMEIVPAARRFLMADTGINIRLKLDRKIDVLRSAVAVAHALGEPLPRVAMMAATESVSGAMPETYDAAELQRRNRAGEFPGCLIQGPLSFDLAYAADAADRKRVAGPVVGAADAMIFPDLLSANLTVKAIMYTAPCRFGGVLRGTTCPVVFMSRADATATRLNSLALALRLLEPVDPTDETCDRIGGVGRTSV